MGLGSSSFMGNMLDIHRATRDAEYAKAKHVAAQVEARIDSDTHPAEFREVLEMLLQPLHMGE